MCLMLPRYIVTGFFEQVPVEKQLGNLECNCTAAVAVTHHFLHKMVAKKLKGCIVFASSVVAYVRAPFSGDLIHRRPFSSARSDVRSIKIFFVTDDSCNVTKMDTKEYPVTP